MKVRFLVVLFICLVMARAAKTASAAPANHAQGAMTHAEFTFVSESAVFNPTTQEVEFTIEFSEPPDFFTVDAFGQPANSFQYFIVGDETLSWPENFDTIIRGVEISLTPGWIPIRSAVPSDPDPLAGGWGAVRGVVSYQLNGNILTFSVPLQLISDHSQDGSLRYELETYHFGSLINHVENITIAPSLAMEIDIRPQNSQNVINPRSKGIISVAVLTTPSLDAATVDPLTVRFGPHTANPIGDRALNQDVDKDGDTDRVFYFRTQDTGILCSTESISLTGETFDGQAVSGEDVIRAVGCQGD